MNNIGLEQINSLEDLDFRKLNLGQQFLITEQRDNKGITYNLITITILSKIVFNDIYYFKESYHHVFPCSDEEEDINTYNDDYETHYLYDNFELYSLHDSDKFIKQHNKIKESLAKEKEEAKKYDMTSIVLDDIYYLIDNFKIKIDNICKCEIYNVRSEYAFAMRQFKELVRFNQIQFKKEVDNTNQIIKNYLVIPIKDNYLCCFIQNEFNPEEYEWHYSEYYFLINKDITSFVKIKFKDNIIKILNDIPEINKSKAFKDFYNFYLINKLDVVDYLKDNSIINNICKTFKEKFLNESQIKRYFEPIYEDNYIIAHLNSKYRISRYDLNIIIKDEQIEDELIKISTKKAEAIYSYYKYPNNRRCNIFTGEPIDNSYKEIYRDAGGLIVASEYNTEFYYTLLDDIYIEANRSERDELLDRQKVVNSLLA